MEAGRYRTLNRITAAKTASPRIDKEGPSHGSTQATPLRVGKRQAPPSKLFAQNPVLLLQVLDNVLLMTIDPSGYGRHQQLELSSSHGR